MPDHDPKPADELSVPLFGSWPRIYAAVVVCAIVVMVLIGLFSTWEW